MKKLILTLLFVLTCCCSFAMNEETKNFNLEADNLYVNSLVVLNKLGFTVEEMQSKSGYILFKTPNSFEYLITISKKGSNGSNIKITKSNSAAPLNEIRQIIYKELEALSFDIPTKAE